jgi:TolB-like protein
MRPDELPIIAVLPLENLTGRKDLAWTGAAVATLVRDDLAQSHFIAVVSAARTMRLAGDHKDMQSLFSAAAEEGITHVLSGEVLRTRKGLTVTSRLTDLRRNVELGANRQEALQPDEALSFSTAIASVVKQGLGLPGTEKVDVFAANFASHNIAAYEAFIAGMQDFLAFDYSDARQSFAVAVQKAPDFAMARYRLAHTLASLGDTDGALQQIEAAKRAAVRLPSRERAYIDAADAYFKRDYAQAERQYRSLLEQHPYETEARLLLLYVLMDQARNEEALVQAET